MKALLGSMTTVFTHEQASRQIRLGAQWLFDSFCESDLQLAFVEAVVVLRYSLEKRLRRMR